MRVPRRALVGDAVVAIFALGQSGRRRIEDGLEPAFDTQLDHATVRMSEHECVAVTDGDTQLDADATTPVGLHVQRRLPSRHRFQSEGLGLLLGVVHGLLLELLHRTDGLKPEFPRRVEARGVLVDQVDADHTPGCEVGGRQSRVDAATIVEGLQEARLVAHAGIGSEGVQRLVRLEVEVVREREPRFLERRLGSHAVGLRRVGIQAGLQLDAEREKSSHESSDHEDRCHLDELVEHEEQNQCCDEEHPEDRRRPEPEVRPDQEECHEDRRSQQEEEERAQNARSVRLLDRDPTGGVVGARVEDEHHDDQERRDSGEPDQQPPPAVETEDTGVVEPAPLQDVVDEFHDDFSSSPQGDRVVLVYPHGQEAVIPHERSCVKTASQ